ncbi:DnaD domain protein [Domibacillus sp. PGB-M46]|uniref:DnaD domain protein n=1 Tax=Domibacillus sp. PGB-M46 TaxID=2910255 RepID=UPI001F5A3519|nr:DnaD domain protein [Domibacillus sp. PGB-M46]MCI2255853.1 DnaD domain protein [Domibacillus sp. PGB-M46]
MTSHNAAAYFKSIHPRQMIMHTTGKDSVSNMDLTVIADLNKRYHLPDEVINVLIQYILLASLSLSHPSLFKIAMHWSRLKVETAEEAMKLVQKEHTKYKTLWMTDILHSKKKTVLTVDMIRGAASSNLTDEQLGAYIRELFARS